MLKDAPAVYCKHASLGVFTAGRGKRKRQTGKGSGLVNVFAGCRFCISLRCHCVRIPCCFGTRCLPPSSKSRWGFSFNRNVGCAAQLARLSLYCTPEDRRTAANSHKCHKSPPCPVNTPPSLVQYHYHYLISSTKVMTHLMQGLIFNFPPVEQKDVPQPKAQVK